MYQNNLDLCLEVVSRSC